MPVLAGCSKPKTDQSATSPQPANTPKATSTTNGIDACSLLTSQEIETILNAPLKGAKPSVNAQGGVTVSQCYFLLPVASDSVVLTVTQMTEGASSQSPKESWDEMFHREKEKENAREEEESKAPPPEQVAGLGDEAFWAPRRFGGVLYVLKGNRSITITVGSGGNQETKLQKLKSLAEMVLKRL
jgi:hypothetical protein